MISIYDRIKELSYVIGTGNITLSGAVRGFSTFSSAYANNSSLFYAITDGLNYEIGSGVYNSSSNEIFRFVIKSTNDNNLVNFNEGAKEVYVNYPATNAIFSTSGINPVPQNSGIAFWTSSNSLSYNNKFIIDSGKSRIGINTNNPSYTIDIGGLSPDSIIRSSGFFVGNSGIYFPSGNNNNSAYSGGVQLVHFLPNQLSTQLSSILQLSGVVNQNILLKKQNANYVFAGPLADCSPPCDPDYPTFRYLTKGDLPEEISNWTIGDEDSSTFLTINLPHGLPDVVYRDINAISVNNENGIFAVNGLGQIKFGTIDYSQVTNLSGIINSVSGMITSTSGILNNRILVSFGYLDNRINLTSGVLNNRINTVSGILNNKIDSVLINNSYVFNDGRLSISSGNPIVDGSGKYIYYTKNTFGNKISLYNTLNNSWQDYALPTYSNISLDLTSSCDRFKIYDIFIYYNNGLKLSAIPWNGYIYEPEFDNYDGTIFSSTQYATSAALSSSIINGNIFPYGSVSINGYTLVGGEQILVKNQIDPIENGIYEVTDETTGLMLSRIYPYYDGYSLEAGQIFYVSSTNKLFQVDSAGAVIIGTDSLNLVEVPLISFNTNSRSSNLTKINDAYVLSSDFTKRYVGTIQTLGPNNSNIYVYDTPTKRLLYNTHNKINKPLFSSKTTPISWSYQSASWRQIPYIDSIQVINGMPSDKNILLNGQVHFNISNLQYNKYCLGIGKNNVFYPASGDNLINIRDILEIDYNDNIRKQMYVSHEENMLVGWNKFYLIEKAKTANAISITINNNSSDDKFGGLFGFWEC